MSVRADLLILDGRHLLWRTSDAYRDLSAEVDGETIGTGGIYGFLSCAFRVHQRYGGMTVVAWEGKNNFRERLYPQYKGRDVEKTPEEKEVISDMSEQECRTIEMLSLMGVRQYRSEGYEADDTIGTLAVLGASLGKRVVIYSGDSDLRQLIRENIWTASPGYGGGKDTIYDAELVQRKHGVPPRLIASMKALAGDASDRIPGVPGCGPVTASSLLNRYGSLKAVLKAAAEKDDGWPVAKRFLDSIRQHAENVRLFAKLTRVRTDAPVQSAARPRKSQKEFVNQLLRYRFRSLVNPLELNGLMSMCR